MWNKWWSTKRIYYTHTKQKDKDTSAVGETSTSIDKIIQKVEKIEKVEIGELTNWKKRNKQNRKQQPNVNK